jgi:hypothetical protein
MIFCGGIFGSLIIGGLAIWYLIWLANNLDEK